MTESQARQAAMELAGRADVLIEALPYLQQFRDALVVVKYGGAAMVDDRARKAERSGEAERLLADAGPEPADEPDPSPATAQIVTVPQTLAEPKPLPPVPGPAVAEPSPSP